MTAPATNSLDVFDLQPPGDMWKRSKPVDRGDSNVRILFEAVGGALSCWEQVEVEFAQVFQWMVQSPSPAAARAYGAIASHSGRRDALNAAANAYFHTGRVWPENFQNKFKRLMEHFHQASARRNEIAHGYVMHFQFDNDDHGYFLVPPFYNTRKTGSFGSGQPKADKWDVMKMDYRFDSSNIQGFSTKFQVLRESCVAFIFDLHREGSK